MSKLKRCPFCGGEARLQKKNRKRGWYVICKNRSCSCSTPFYQNTFTSEENLKRVAIEVWNTRKPMERIVERLEEGKIKSQQNRSDALKLNDLVTTNVECGRIQGLQEAIEIVREEGGMNE